MRLKIIFVLPITLAVAILALPSLASNEIWTAMQNAKTGKDMVQSLKKSQQTGIFHLYSCYYNHILKHFIEYKVWGQTLKTTLVDKKVCKEGYYCFESLPGNSTPSGHAECLKPKNVLDTLECANDSAKVVKLEVDELYAHEYFLVEECPPEKSFCVNGKCVGPNCKDYDETDAEALLEWKNSYPHLGIPELSILKGSYMEIKGDPAAPINIYPDSCKGGMLMEQICDKNKQLTQIGVDCKDMGEGSKCIDIGEKGNDYAYCEIMASSKISAGGALTCAITKGVDVECAGWLLGYPNNPAENFSGFNSCASIKIFGINNPPVSVSAGDDHNCAIQKTKDLACWGYNEFGQLGDSGKQNSAPAVFVLPSVKKVSAGSQATCAITEGDGVKCWGKNDHGQLGLGVKGSPTLLPTNVKNLPADVLDISTNGNQTCAVTLSGDIYCWGAFGEGQPSSNGAVVDKLLPTKIDGLPEPAVQVGVGKYHACALLTSGKVFCWGSNGKKQITGSTSLPEYMDKPVEFVLDQGMKTAKIDAGDFFNCGLTTNGEVYCWGFNNLGQLGIGDKSKGFVTLPDTALEIATGSAHACALLKNDDIYCWGYNNNCQLGVPLGEDSAMPKKSPLEVGFE